MADEGSAKKRRIVAKRPGVLIAIGMKPKGDGDAGRPGAGMDDGADGHPVVCRACGATIDSGSGHVLEPPPRGKDMIDPAESGWPEPGPGGTAADASMGQNALTNAVASVLAGRTGGSR